MTAPILHSTVDKPDYGSQMYYIKNVQPSERACLNTYQKVAFCGGLVELYRASTYREEGMYVANTHHRNDQ